MNRGESAAPRSGTVSTTAITDPNRAGKQYLFYICDAVFLLTQVGYIYIHDVYKCNK